MTALEQNIDKVNQLCRTHYVKSLYAFGSVLTPSFNSKSDIDLIVDFETVNEVEYADNYYDLKFSLETLLKAPVDLLEEKGIKNPYFRKEIESRKQLIYGR